MTSRVPPLLRKRHTKLAPVEKIPAPKESELQNATAEFLTDWCKRDWRWTHFPAGGKRPLFAGIAMKKGGLRKGWPDFQLISPAGRYHGLELKRHGETLTDEQEEFQAWCQEKGIPHVVAFDRQGVMDALKSWGALRVKFIGGVPTTEARG
jgi:hypothetical protein